MEAIKTITKGLAGIAGLEITDNLTETLTTTAVQATGIATDTATAVIHTVTNDVSNPIGIIDALLKVAVALATLWSLIKKPKPKQAN